VLRAEGPQMPSELAGVRPARQPQRRNRSGIGRQGEVAVARGPAAGRQRGQQHQALLDPGEAVPPLLDRQANGLGRGALDASPARALLPSGSPTAAEPGSS
jgi:hypothetical protein